jgi:hypothetical protein
MADQLTEPPYDRAPIVPPELGWKALLPLDGAALEAKTSEILETLGVKPGMLGVVFKGARCGRLERAASSSTPIHVRDESLSARHRRRHESCRAHRARQSLNAMETRILGRARESTVRKEAKPHVRERGRRDREGGSAEIADDLEAALAQFTKIAARLSPHEWAKPHRHCSFVCKFAATVATARRR